MNADTITENRVAALARIMENSAHEILTIHESIQKGSISPERAADWINTVIAHINEVAK